MVSYFGIEDASRLVAGVDWQKLQSYLISQGWQEVGTLREVASIWHRPEREGSNSEVILPITPNAKDYEYSLYSALLAIAEHEDINPSKLASKIAGYLADRISVRVIHEDVSDGTIPLNDGVTLNLRARDLMAAAALSTNSKRKQFSGARSPETTAYLNTLRLGQTEVGSYIVNVIAPLHPAEVTQTAIPTKALAQVVTENLIKSLEALNEASIIYIERDDLSVFDSTVDKGVSANMCDALLGLSGEGQARQFEIEVCPSPSEDGTELPSKFHFSESKILSIKRASEYFKDNYVLPDKTIIGFVKRLDRPRGDENGTVVIEATLVGHEKHISIVLGPEDYLEAVNAHKAKEPVRCHGDIHVTARKAHMLNPTGFAVLRSDDLL